MSEVLDFGVESDFITRIPVKYDGKEYVLKSATAEDAVIYENAQLRATQRDPQTGNIISQIGMADTEPLLVSRCLWDKDEKQRIPESVIRAWPAKVLNSLFNRAKEISHFGQYDDPASLREYIDRLQKTLKRIEGNGQEEQVKNSPSGTPVG